MKLDPRSSGHCPSRTLKGSVDEAASDCQVTPVISPRKATLTPSNRLLTHTDLRRRLITNESRERGDP